MVGLFVLLIGIDTQLGVFRHLNAIAIAIVAVLIARALVVYPTLFKLPSTWKFVVFWGGLRGAIPVALALSLSGVPYGDLLSSMVFGVVLFSLVFQGLTLELFIKRTIRDTKREEFEMILGRYLALRQAEFEIKRMIERGKAVEFIAEDIAKEIEKEIEQVKAKIVLSEDPKRDIKRRLLRDVLNAEKYAVRSALAKGLISESAASKLIREIDSKIEELED